MNGFQREIARFLAAKAARKSRATYQQVGEAVGWSHPYGRGLGGHLWIILQELAELGLPPLTAILVKKGEALSWSVQTDGTTVSGTITVTNATDMTTLDTFTYFVRNTE